MTDRFTILQGDVLETLRTLGDASFDAMFGDPPYGIRFLSCAWDHGVPSVDVWREALRVVKPGAALLAFGGTRTAHRLAANIEDGGFEIRDSIAWIYGEGMPKSLDVSKALDEAAGEERPVVARNEAWAKLCGKKDRAGTWAGQAAGFAHPERVGDVTAPVTDLAVTWDGYGTNLKPAFEPAILARRPLDGTVVENVTRWGVGGLAIDASRVATDWSDRSEAWKRSGHSAKPDAKKIAAPPGIGIVCHDAGRWPANVIFDEAAAALLDEQTGVLETHGGSVRPHHAGMGFGGGAGSEREVAASSGGASRFFYCAKASTAERHLGCDEENDHPTIKPVALTRYLARLILPPSRPSGAPRRILVPFSGSGSEMIGCLLAGWDEVVGIEREAVYVARARQRCAHAAANPRAWEDPAVRATKAKPDDRQADLFGAAPAAKRRAR